MEVIGLSDLPLECVDYMFDFCSASSLIVSQLVCKLWSDFAIRRLRRLYPHGGFGPAFLKEAAKEGHISLMIWGRVKGAPNFNTAMYYLFKRGYFDQLKQLNEFCLELAAFPSPPSPFLQEVQFDVSRALMFTVCSGRIDKLEWVLSYAPNCCPDSSFWERVGRKGNVDALEWAIARLPRDYAAVVALVMGIAKKSQIHMFSVLQTHNIITLPVIAVTTAAAHGQIAVIRHFAPYNGSVDYMAGPAVRGGQTCVLDWLRDNTAWDMHAWYDADLEVDGMPILCEAIRNGYLEILRWFHNCGIGFRRDYYRIIVSAIQTDQIQILDWLVSVGVVIPALTVSESITEDNLLSLAWACEYFHKHPDSHFSRRIWHCALNARSVSMFEILNEHGVKVIQDPIDYILRSEEIGLGCHAPIQWLHDHGFRSRKWSWITGKNYDAIFLKKLLLAGIMDIGSCIPKRSANVHELFDGIIEHCEGAGVPIPWGVAIYNASYRRDIKLLERLYSFGATETGDSCMAAIIRHPGESRMKAFRQGFPVVQWLYRQDPYRNHNKNLMLTILYADDIEAIRWAYQQRLPWSARTNTAYRPNLADWMIDPKNHGTRMWKWINKNMNGLKTRKRKRNISEI